MGADCTERVSATDGPSVGERVGFSVGTPVVGNAVGVRVDGAAVGAFVLGCTVGGFEGTGVGENDSVGDFVVGALDGIGIFTAVFESRLAKLGCTVRTRYATRRRLTYASTFSTEGLRVTDICPVSASNGTFAKFVMRSSDPSSFIPATLTRTCASPTVACVEKESTTLNVVNRNSCGMVSTMRNSVSCVDGAFDGAAVGVSEG